MPSEQHPRAYPVLFASTFAFMVCFAVWMMFGVVGIPLKETLGLNNTEFGLLTSMPVLLGAAMRLPLGIWTDRFGGRAVMTALLVAAALPVYLVGYATQYWQLLAIGLPLGRSSRNSSARGMPGSKESSTSSPHTRSNGTAPTSSSMSTPR